MPGFDQTGPRGDGPMSGRARGICRSTRTDDRQVQGAGFGQGRGRRQKRGFRYGAGNPGGRRLGERSAWPPPGDTDLND